jgi:holliday junction resolvase YEN1
LYYRLLRLLSISVQPLFVFDGPHKPPFKRNKKTGHHGAMLPNLLTKQLLKLFGFPFHVAPGEAEAECALLQREGLVDAVLSEDVDTLMFACGLALRNWSSEGTRGSKSPTHVSVYNAVKTKQGKSGLDREGMVLIALMSGGDYITEGIPGCGIKVASEAARAGFGKSLCRISRSDAAGLEAWRKNLAHEIQSNESKFFRTKHKALKIPEEFPNREVLSYYTHPVVSSAPKLQSLKEGIEWEGEVDVPGLRLYVAEAFDWTSKIGAIKFIRGLAPALLVHKLRIRGDRRDSGYGDVILTAMNEMQLVRTICGKRTHISSDGIPEMRVIYQPMDIVGINLDEEPDDSGDYGRDGLAPVNEDEQIEAYQSDEEAARARSVSPQKRPPSVYDPTQPDKAWIPETIAKVGIPLKVEDYEESLRNPRKFIKAKAAAKRAEKKGGMPKGAMDMERKLRHLHPANLRQLQVKLYLLSTWHLPWKD